MTNENWVIITSKSGLCRDGYPVGRIFCIKSREESIIKNYNIVVLEY